MLACFSFKLVMCFNWGPMGNHCPLLPHILAFELCCEKTKALHKNVYTPQKDACHSQDMFTARVRTRWFRAYLSSVDDLYDFWWGLWGLSCKTNRRCLQGCRWIRLAIPAVKLSVLPFCVNNRYLFRMFWVKHWNYSLCVLQWSGSRRSESLGISQWSGCWPTICFTSSLRMQCEP